MKTIKKLFCALLCAALVVGTFAGCHKKGEIGVTVTDSKLSEKTGKVEFTSAYYMCALIMSYNSGKSEINQKYQDEKKSTTDIDYFKEKIDKKKFNDWVIDNTEKSLKKIAAFKIKCAENKLTVKDEDKSSAEQYAEAYWTNTNYNYSEYFEPNGVSLDTYKAYMVDAYYAQRYFDFIYKGDGEKAISDETILKTMQSDYMLCDVLDISFDNIEDSEKESKKTFANDAAAQINAGKKSYAQVYAEYNSSDTVTEDNTTDSSKPIDSLASVIGTKDTSYNTYSDYFEQLSSLAAGTATVIEKADNAGVILFVKKDITADPYYKTNLDDEIRNFIAGDEFTKEIEAYAKTLKYDIKGSVKRRFKPKKIQEPKTSTSTSSY